MLIFLFIVRSIFAEFPINSFVLVWNRLRGVSELGVVASSIVWNQPEESQLVAVWNSEYKQIQDRTVSVTLLEVCDIKYDTIKEDLSIEEMLEVMISRYPVTLPNLFKPRLFPTILLTSGMIYNQYGFQGILLALKSVKIPNDHKLEFMQAWASILRR